MYEKENHCVALTLVLALTLSVPAFAETYAPPASLCGPEDVSYNAVLDTYGSAINITVTASKEVQEFLQWWYRNNNIDQD